ncbi:hypothetical protein B0O80DRAFT_433831 [Mortierella sp. GBAus27b]|nr:hypothetical protein B0O80DRAFT_433831 [Mortierella sp. GBAus27b]
MVDDVIGTLNSDVSSFVQQKVENAPTDVEAFTSQVFDKIDEPLHSLQAAINDGVIIGLYNALSKDSKQPYHDSLTNLRSNIDQLAAKFSQLGASDTTTLTEASNNISDVEGQFK